jgi:hypothetical protein
MTLAYAQPTRRLWQAEITGRASGRNAHPAETPGTKLRAKVRGHGEQLVRFPGGRSAQVCAKGRAADDRKARRERNSTGRADDVDTSTFLHALACRSRTDDLLITRRTLSVAYALYKRFR